MKPQWSLLKLVLMCIVLGYPRWSDASFRPVSFRDRFCWAIEAENIPLLKTAIATEAEQLKPLGWRSWVSQNGYAYTYASECDSDGLCNLTFFLEFKEDQRAHQLWVYDYREQRFGFRRKATYLEMSKHMDELLAPLVSRKAQVKDCFAFEQ